MNFTAVNDIIKIALMEDIGTGDITTDSTICDTKKIKGKFIAKEDGVICGLEVVELVFRQIDHKITLTANVKDGDAVKKGDIIAQVEGGARGVLTGERVALNFLQHLSAVATKTAAMVNMVKGTKAKIADTRKTTPGMRILEKYAVKTGGGTNHRFNLSDGILIKDNHINAAGSVTAAVNAAKQYAPHTLKIEVEVESMEQIKEALEAGCDIIMLDNMDIALTSDAVRFIGGRALVEASGNMEGKDLKAVAATGVDIISVGALTHSVKSMDISLRFY